LKSDIFLGRVKKVSKKIFDSNDKKHGGQSMNRLLPALLVGLIFGAGYMSSVRAEESDEGKAEHHESMQEEDSHEGKKVKEYEHKSPSAHHKGKWKRHYKKEKAEEYKGGK